MIRKNQHGNLVNSFHATGLSPYPLKRWENQNVLYVLKGYRNRRVALDQ